MKGIAAVFSITDAYRFQSAWFLKTMELYEIEAVVH
jgi:hypothetical protein